MGECPTVQSGGQAGYASRTRDEAVGDKDGVAGGAVRHVSAADVEEPCEEPAQGYNKGGCVGRTPRRRAGNAHATSSSAATTSALTPSARIAPRTSASLSASGCPANSSGSTKPHSLGAAGRSSPQTWHDTSGGGSGRES